MKQTKQQLLDILEGISNLIRNNDSFAGTLTYSPAKDCWRDSGAVISEWDGFEVSALIRTNNSEGQGGAFVLLRDKENSAWNSTW